MIELAAAGLYRARWTQKIEDEWVTAICQNRRDLDPKRLRHTADLMNSVVPDCMIKGFEFLSERLTLPDADDRHVLAAAIRGKADAIVTYNLKDFPAATLDQYDIEPLHPDDFLIYQFGIDVAAVLGGARSCRVRLRRPPLAVREYLDALTTLRLPQLVMELSRYSALI